MQCCTLGLKLEVSSSKMFMKWFLSEFETITIYTEHDIVIDISGLTLITSSNILLEGIYEIYESPSNPWIILFCCQSTASPSTLF